MGKTNIVILIRYLSRNTLCRTLAGNKCEYLTITSKETDPMVM
jgi:hypothetical protein